MPLLLPIQRSAQYVDVQNKLSHKYLQNDAHATWKLGSSGWVSLSPSYSRRTASLLPSSITNSLPKLLALSPNQNLLSQGLKESGPLDLAVQYIAVWFATNSITITYIRHCKKRSKTCSNCLTSDGNSAIEPVLVQEKPAHKYETLNMREIQLNLATAMNYETGGAELRNWRCSSGSCSGATNSCMRVPSIEKWLSIPGLFQ